MKSVKKVATILVSVLLWAIILSAALFTFTTMATKDKDHIANLFGYTPMTVQSDSMAPEFYAGDMIIVQDTDVDTLQVGDVICFRTIIENVRVLNTHRITAIEDSNGYLYFTTKGDNNIVTDSSIVGEGDIVGKYVGKISGLGKFMDFLGSKIGFLIVIVLPMLIFFIYQVYQLIMVSNKLKKAQALETAQQQAEILAQSTDNSEAERMKAEAAAALEEAKRIRAEAEAKLAEAKKESDKQE